MCVGRGQGRCVYIGHGGKVWVGHRAGGVWMGHRAGVCGQDAHRDGQSPGATG